MKALCAVVFVLSSLGAPAQALDASTAYCVDDFFGGIIEQSTIPAQIIATEPAIEKFGEAVDEAHGVTTTGPKDAANVPVGAIQTSDETRTVEYATGKGNKLTVHGTIEQNTIPAQIVATEPAIEKLGEPDDIAITGANDVKVVPVKTIQASSATESSTRSDDKLTRDDRLDQGTMAPQIVTTEPTIKKLSGATPEVDGITMTAPDNAQDAPVGAIQTRDETRTVESSSRHDDKPKLDVPIEQTTMSAQTMAPGPAIQTLDQPVGATIPAPSSVEGLPVQGDLPQQQTPSVGVLSAE